jgi:hypothetical protein
VYIVDAVPNRPLNEHRFVPLTKGRKLVELRGDLDAVLAQAAEAGDAHVRVVLDVEQPEPGLAQRVREQLPAAVDVRLEYPDQPQAESEGLAHLNPEEQFVRYYQSQHAGNEPAPALLALFRELYEQARASDLVGAEVSS